MTNSAEPSFFRCPFYGDELRGRDTYAYPLFSALSAILPSLHGRGGLQIELVPSLRCVEFRGMTEKDVASFEGQQLHVNGATIVLGAPEPVAVRPMDALACEILIFRAERGRFQDQLRRTLPDGVQYHVGASQILKYKDLSFIGRQVSLSGLSEDQSMLIQKNGIGKFRSMGCGIFRASQFGGNASS